MLSPMRDKNTASTAY